MTRRLDDPATGRVLRSADIAHLDDSTTGRLDDPTTGRLDDSTTNPSRRYRTRAVAAIALAAIVVAAGCRQKMSTQPRYDPLEPSAFFENGMSARPRIAGTVARGDLSGDPFFDSGRINGQLADGFPIAVTEELMNRGQERYDIYCTPCHGALGDGDGMIPSRGLRRPPSFHTETLRTATTGHFFDIMTNGFGAMPPYRTMIPPRDRWAIVAYIRALQLSQHAPLADVPAADRARLDQPATAAPAPAQGGSH